MSRQWRPFMITETQNSLDQGMDVGIFPALNSTLFPSKSPVFLSFSFCFFRHLTFREPFASSFSLVKKSLHLLYLCAKKSMYDLFWGKKPLPLLVTANHCSNKFCVVLKGSSVFPNVLDGCTLLYDQHQPMGLNYGLTK